MKNILFIVFLTSSLFGAEKARYILAGKKLIMNALQKNKNSFKTFRPFHTTTKLTSSDFNTLLNTFYLTRYSPLDKKLTITPNRTQTEQHLKYFINNKLWFDQNKLKIFTANNKQFFEQIYNQEIIEHEKGNYVLYHARNWQWNFLADIYKQLWQIINKQNCNTNFQFLRFGMSPQYRKNIYDDIVYTNCALFSNLTSLSSCSIHYWYNNFDYSKEKILYISEIFISFKLNNIFNKYESELNELLELHKAITVHGEILLISIAKDKLENVITIDTAVTINDRWKLKPEDILDTLQSGMHMFLRSLDNAELGLILGSYNQLCNYIPNPYTNDPVNGPDIFSFSLIDDERLQEYTILRDEIFSKIKTDIETNS